MATFAHIGDRLIVDVENVSSAQLHSSGVVRIHFKQVAHSHGAAGGSYPAYFDVLGVDFAEVLQILQDHS